MSENRRSADSEIGQRIRTRRKSLGITQAELASSLGISFQQLQKYEKGINAVAERRLVQICTILKISPSFFISDEPMIGSSTNLTAKDLEAIGDQTLPALNTLLADAGLRNNELRCLVEAFVSISDAKIRARIVQFVCGLAEDVKK